MADTQGKKPIKVSKIAKKHETVRERADKAVNATPKSRRLRTGASAASKPFRAVGKLISRLFRPLAIVGKPFKTRPVRAVGRFISRVLLFGFFRNAWQEVRQVVWPNAQQTVRLTYAVFAFSVAFGVVVALVDFGLDKLFKKVFLQ